MRRESGDALNQNQVPLRVLRLWGNYTLSTEFILKFNCRTQAQGSKTEF